MSSDRRAAPSSALHDRIVEVIDAIREVSKVWHDEVCRAFQIPMPDGMQHVDQGCRGMGALLDLIVAVEPQTAGMRAARVAAAKLKSGLSADYMPPAARGWTPFVQVVQDGLGALDRARSLLVEEQRDHEQRAERRALRKHASGTLDERALRAQIVMFGGSGALHRQTNFAHSASLPWLSWISSRGMRKQIAWAATRTLHRSGVPAWRLSELIRSSWPPYQLLVQCRGFGP